MLIFNPVIGKLFSMLRTTCICEHILSTVNFMNSKCRISISDENLTFRLWYASKYKLFTGFQSFDMNKRM